MPTKNRLSATDWADAALQQLLSDGPGAIAVQPLARMLGATKGSFYWHYATRDELLRAVLERWQVVATDDVIAAVDATTDGPVAKARAFARQLAEFASSDPGRLQLSSAAEQPDIRAAVEAATTRRVGFLARQLRAAGHSRAVAGRRATNAYALVLGHAQLAACAPSALPASARGRRDLLDELLDELLADVS